MPDNIPKHNRGELKTSLGQYSLQKKIAQGGMAEIYKGIAEDIHGIKRTVVIKKILPHIAANQEFVDMLVSEAKIAVQLSHGNIAQIYDLGRSDDNYFMVMEFVDGRSLSQIHKRCIKDGRLMPLQYALYFISEVASGLDYMHNKRDQAGTPLGIVHRDISPQNIIISYSGTVKIIDFGIAKAASKIDRTEAGILKGKFAYMSPEQARGEAIDSRSDIFSLGVILHEMITGRRLFKDKDNKATIKNVRRAEVDIPSEFNSEVPKELDKIVLKALAKDAAKRYQRAGNLHNDLVKLLYTKYPDFKPSQVRTFIESLFGPNETEITLEDENTPVLIFDQTQPAIKLDVPSVLKEFMLEETAPEKAEVAEPKNETPKIEDKGEEPAGEPVPEKVSRLKRSAPKLLKIAKVVLAAGIIAGIVYGGKVLGLWQGWSDFFNAVTISTEKEKEVPPAPVVIDISSDPSGASIFLDDIETGYRTPHKIEDFTADKKAHKVGIYLDDHKFAEFPFTANEGTIKISAKLELAFGEFEVITFPEGATVILNGENAGVSPLKKGNIPPDTIFNIRIEKEGYIPLEDSFKISPNNATIIRGRLAMAPKKLVIPKVSEATEAEIAPKPPEQKKFESEIVIPAWMKKEGEPSAKPAPELPPVPSVKDANALPEREETIPPVPEIKPVARPKEVTEEPAGSLEITEKPLPPVSTKPGAPAPAAREEKMELDYNN